MFSLEICRFRGIFWLAIALVAGCAATSTPRAPTLAGPISVVEVQHANVCGTQGEAPRISLFKDVAELQAWETSHNIDLSGGPLRQGAYALVELGERSTGGYGILISRRAKLRDGTIRLTATFLTPPPGQVTTQIVSSPCVLVSLPKVDILSLILLDPNGKQRARSHAEIITPTVAPKVLPDLPPAPPLSEPEIPAAAPSSQ